MSAKCTDTSFPSDQEMLRYESYLTGYGNGPISNNKPLYESDPAESKPNPRLLAEFQEQLNQAKRSEGKEDKKKSEKLKAHPFLVNGLILENYGSNNVNLRDENDSEGKETGDNEQKKQETSERRERQVGKMMKEIPEKDDRIVAFPLDNYNLSESDKLRLASINGESNKKELTRYQNVRKFSNMKKNMVSFKPSKLEHQAIVKPHPFWSMKLK